MEEGSNGEEGIECQDGEFKFHLLKWVADGHCR